MNWTGKKVLVTGAGGFIGSHLAEALAMLGAQVTALVHYNARGSWGNLEFLPEDLKSTLRVDAGMVEDAAFTSRLVRGHEIVFHLAALIAIPYSYAAPASYVRTNIEGTLNLLEASREHGIERFVHTSTSETYGTAVYTPIDEHHPLQGQSPYSASKIGADKLAESYYRSFKLPVATVRPFNTFGPRQSARAVLPAIIAQALTRPEIRLGALDPVRDMNYVLDTVAGFISIAESEQAVGEVINIGSGRGISIGELARLTLARLGVDKPIVLDAQRQRPKTSEVYTLVCDHRKALRLTNWQGRFSLEEGIDATIAFIKDHLTLYKPGVYAV